MADYLILNFEGEDGATTWVEEAQGLELASNWGCELDTAQFYAGTSSLRLPGSENGAYCEYTIPDVPANFNFITRFRYTGGLDYVQPVCFTGNTAIISIFCSSGDWILMLYDREGTDLAQSEILTVIPTIDTWTTWKFVTNGRDISLYIDDLFYKTWTAGIDDPFSDMYYWGPYNGNETEGYDIWIDRVFIGDADEPDEYDEYDEYEEPEEPEENPTWISQGKFFIERPTFQVGLNETTTGVWGRQETAILGEPFAQKVTKLWDADTTFYAICQEIIESVGLVWDPDKCDIQDFAVYADNFEADNQYPIETLQALVELIVGAEGFVTSDRLGNICIKRLERAPETSDFDLTDLIIQSINEEPEWPEFGNRIKIIPVESVSQNTIVMDMSSECIGMSTTEPTYIDVWAQVKDGEGTPLNDQVVVWSFYPAEQTRLGFIYPISGSEDLQTTVSQNTAIILISKEIVRADSLVSLTTKFEASSIIGIWAYADITRSVNFAADDGYVIDGNKVYLTDNQFDFCDQMVVISYYASGMVMNTVVYDPTIV